MRMERGDCGPAGQLFDSAFLPTIYHFNRGRGMHMNNS